MTKIYTLGKMGSGLPLFYINEEMIVSTSTGSGFRALCYLNDGGMVLMNKHYIPLFICDGIMVKHYYKEYSFILYL